MAQIKAVPDATVGPKAGKTRRVSASTAPYMNLAQSVEVARVLQQAGGSLDRTQLAAKLSYSGTNNGTFLMRVSAAKIFGLVDQPPQSDMVRVTPRGTSIVAPVSDADAQRAKLDAFMSVDLYKNVYNEYKGRELPPEVGLANLFENTYGVIPNRSGPAVKTMMESAEQAGLFTMAGLASRKMIAPPPVSGAITPVSTFDQPPAGGRSGGGGRAGGGGGNGNGEDGGGHDATRIHPAIYGLIADLPPAGGLTKAKRDALIAAFTAMMLFIYATNEE